MATERLCYLCGEPCARRASKDHVPPLMFFARELRKQVNPDLETLPTHSECNRAFQEDEEYFVHSFCWFGKDTVAGRAVINDVARAMAKAEKTGLRRKIGREWDSQPSGLWLPRGQAVKKFDRARVERVVWKIVRGIHMLESGEILPEGMKRHVELRVGAEDRPTEEELELTNAAPRGRYPGVFDYKYRLHVPDPARKLHAWALLFWDCMIAFVFAGEGERPAPSSGA